MKKVLLLTISYPPVLNSAARLFSELAESLQKRGYSVTVITSIPQRYLAGSKRTFPKVEEINNVTVHRLPMIPFPKGIPLSRAFEHFFVALQYWFKGRSFANYDAVIAYSPPLPLALTGIRLAMKWKATSIINVQDLYPQSVVDLGLLRNHAFIRMAQRMERWSYSHADFITVHSEGNREYVISHGATDEKVYTIPNWVDLEKYKPGPMRNSFRERYGLNNSFVVSYAGVMGFAQGGGDILRAAALLEEKIPDFSLILAGGGVESQKLKELARKLGLKRVRFLPHLPEGEYIELLQASDACLVTLAKDLHTPVVPGKLPCIMAVGRPAVCSVPPTSGARRIIEESNSGVWAEAGDYKALASNILELYSDTDVREKMGQHGRAYAEAHFDRRKCIDVYERLLLGGK